jgi:hypothetical protein
VLPRKRAPIAITRTSKTGSPMTIPRNGNALSDGDPAGAAGVGSDCQADPGAR